MQRSRSRLPCLPCRRPHLCALPGAYQAWRPDQSPLLPHAHQPLQPDRPQHRPTHASVGWAVNRLDIALTSIDRMPVVRLGHTMARIVAIGSIPQIRADLPAEYAGASRDVVYRLAAARAHEFGCSLMEDGTTSAVLLIRRV